MESPSHDLQDATNNFFEARVMVMGFKSRALILQGQLEASQHECEQLRAQLEQRQQDREQSIMLGRVKLEKERLEGEIKNFEGVVNLLEKDIKELKDKQNVATDTIKKRDEEITRLNNALQAQNSDYDELYRAYQRATDVLQKQVEEMKNLPQKLLPRGPIPAKRMVLPRDQVSSWSQGGLPDERAQQQGPPHHHQPPSSPPLPRPSQKFLPQMELPSNKM